MSWKFVHSVWALVCCPRKLRLGAQTLCMSLLLLAATTSPARADCPAAPIADPNDMAISFLAANGVQAASASLLASSVEEGTLVYDDTADKLKVCDGTNWIDVGSGSGSDTLASLSCASGEIAKYNGTAWACAADGGGASTAPSHLIKGLSAGQSGLAAGTVIQFKTQISSGGSKIIHSGNRIIVAGDSSYMLRAFIRQGTANSAVDYGIYDVTNSAFVPSTTASANSSTNFSDTDLMAFVAPNASTTYEVRVVNGGGSALAGYSYFSALELSGGSDTLAGLSCATNEILKWNGTAWACAADAGGGGSPTPVTFYATRTTNATSGTTLTFDSEAFDTANSFANGSGTFTAPQTGVYQFTWGLIGSQTSDVYRIYLRKNGSAAPVPHARSDATATGSEYAQSNVTAYLSLTAGDTVSLFFQSDGANAAISDASRWIHFGGNLVGSGSDTLVGLSCSTNEIPKWNGSSWACAADDGGSVTAAGSANEIQFREGGNLQADSTFVYDNVNDRVGIGTNSPSSTLHLNSSASFVNQAFTSNGDAGDVAFYVGRDSDSAWLWNDDNSPIVLATDGTERMYVTGTGNVGIGTASPSAKLEVSGDITLSANAASYRTISTPSNSDTSLILRAFSSSAIGGNIELLRTGANVYDASIHTYRKADGTGGFAVIDPTNGAVGVGTISPAATALLDLNSTAKGFLPPRMTTAQRDAITSPAEGLVVYNTTTKALNLRVASKWLSFGGSMTGNTMVSGWPDAILCFNGSEYRPAYLAITVTGGTRHYRILNNNFGDQYFVYFSSGAYSTHNSAGAYDCASSGYSIAQLYAMGRAFNFVGGATASADGSAGQIQFNEGGNLKADAALHWDNINKRLGIGTASPQSQLHLTGKIVSDSYNDTLVANAYNSGGWKYTSNAPAWNLGGWSGDSTVFRLLTAPSGTAGATVSWRTTLAVGAANGNIGLGTTTPTERLDLGGGNIAMGWERIENNCGNVGANTMCTATCSAGKYATGGACNMGGGAWTNWYQIPGTNSYTCVNNAATKMATSVYCANIR